MPPHAGDEGHGWSEELSFKLPGGYPIKCAPPPACWDTVLLLPYVPPRPEVPHCLRTLRHAARVRCPPLPCRVGVMGDLGQTANSTVTVAGLVDAEPDVLISLGDNSCECGGTTCGRGGTGWRAAGGWGLQQPFLAPGCCRRQRPQKQRCRRRQNQQRRPDLLPAVRSNWAALLASSGTLPAMQLLTCFESRAKTAPHPTSPTLDGACRRWDAWARMMQQLQARVPFVGTGGNHVSRRGSRAAAYRLAGRSSERGALLRLAAARSPGLAVRRRRLRCCSPAATRPSHPSMPGA